MKVYLDACCLNRPFDDQSQPRVRLETEAVSLILEKLAQGEWDWVGSEILLHEVSHTLIWKTDNGLYLLHRWLVRLLRLMRKSYAVQKS